MPYNPQLHILASDAVGYSNGTPADARSKFFDEVNFLYRPYVGTVEVLEYLVTEEDRNGQFLIIINTGGVSQPNGDVIGGTNAVWCFLNGTADANLVILFEEGSGGLVSVNTFADLPPVGETGVIYLTLDTSNLYVWTGNPGPSGYTQTPNPAGFIQNQLAVVQPADFRISGKAMIGAGADNGAPLQVKGGAIATATSNADYPFLNGAIFYRSDTNKLRIGVDGAYQNIATENNVIHNQNAVVQPAAFRINGSSTIDVGAATYYPLVLKNNIPGAGVVLLLATNANPAGGQLVYGGGGDTDSWQLISTNFKVVIQKALIDLSAGTNPNFGGILLKNFWMGATEAVTSYGVGPNAWIVYDALNVQYRLVILPNGDVIIGGHIGNGAKFQVQGGVLSLAAATSDYPVVNGGLFFRSDTQKMRVGINGAWKNITTEETAMLSGYVLSVDKNNVNATDTRTGTSRYSQSVPFKTINAAANAAVGGDLVYVHTGTYTEDILCSRLVMVMGPSVQIVGTVTVQLQCIIRGDFPLFPRDQFGTNQYGEPYAVMPSSITANSANPTVLTASAQANVEQSLITGVQVENTGSGHAINSLRGVTVNNCRVLAKAGTGVWSQAREGAVNNSYIYSDGSATIGVNYAINSTLISMGVALEACMSGAGFVTVENCKIYSKTGPGVSFSNGGGRLVFRNNHVNTFHEALFHQSSGTFPAGATYAEVTGNIMNVRNPATIDTFYVLIQFGASEPGVFMDNRYSKATVFFNVNSLTNVDVNNVPSLAFPANYPKIGNSLQSF